MFYILKHYFHGNGGIVVALVHSCLFSIIYFTIFIYAVVVVVAVLFVRWLAGWF